VLIHHDLVVGAVDGVVQHGAVEPDLDVLHRAKGPVQRERLALTHHEHLTGEAATPLAVLGGLLLLDPREPFDFRHYEREETGYGIVLMDPRLGIAIGLHANTANRGEAFDECRTGLDHISFGVADRDELAAWVARLDELGIQHTGIRDEKEPMAYSTVVFRDPDNIQLEFIAFG
jgi:glyoxylase I family protein